MSAIQVRDVPESIHRRLRAKAAASGRSLSDYVLAVLERDVEMVSPEEVWQRARDRGEGAIAPSDVVTMIRSDRER